MNIRGKRMPTRKICPISRIAILAQGQFLKSIMAADKPITTPPANNATSVSREGCQRKSLETIGLIIGFLLWMDLIRCDYSIATETIYFFFVCVLVLKHR